MKLELIRQYHPQGTNGQLYVNGALLCYTIELPWLNNKPRLSCIPEGNYQLKKRFSAKFGNHLLLMNVVNRSLILIHPANDAGKELKGCIAPVSICTAPGKGLYSKKAFRKLIDTVWPVLSNEPVAIIITSK